jgi:type II secretory pathway component PulF
MALYMYQAFSRDGKQVTGTLDAGSVQGVKEQLVRTGLLPIKIELVSAKTSTGGLGFFKNLFGPRVTLKDKIFFTKQLAVLLKAGVPLLDALELLIEQTEKGLRTIIISLKDNVKEGRSLADSMLQFPKVFDTTYVQLVKAGEASGSLERILERLTQYLSESQELRTKIKGALRMPLIQLGIMLIIVTILLTVVVPQIATTFTSQGGELPLPTRILMGISNFLVDHYLVLLISIIVLVGSFFWWKSTAAGSRMYDRILLKVPLFGYFVRMQAVVQFSRTLGMLIEGGVNLAEALTIVTKVVDNKILVDTLQQARENIIKQGKIAEYLKQTNLFPPLAIYLINTGEKSGQLGEMLLQVANIYEAELREFADTFVTILNAAMPAVMGLIVGMVVLAIGMPMMKISEVVEKRMNF